MIKFYSRYEDNTLIVEHNEHNDVHDALNHFHKNTKFNIGKFENETLHFLDIEIVADGLITYHKEHRQVSVMCQFDLVIYSIPANTILSTN